jgi:hypothetical protein
MKVLLVVKISKIFQGTLYTLESMTCPVAEELSQIRMELLGGFDEVMGKMGQHLVA